ncbi:MAG: S8 family peptidase [Planctomycetota bacterium]|jgi:subtilisin family serine protease
MKSLDALKKMRAVISLCCLVFLFAAPSVVAGGKTAEYHPSRVLIKFKSPPSDQLLAKIKSKHGLELMKIIRKLDVYRMEAKHRVGIPELASQIAKEELVEYAEPDYIRYATYTPNDPSFSQQWGLLKVGVSDYWDVEMGSPDVVVAVLDTGMDLDHPDLVSQLWVNAGEVPGNEVDDDGNGYVDDIYGYDFHGDGLIFVPPDAEDPVPEDDNGHGTHVSGRVAAATDNNVGVAGMAPNVKIMVVRVLGGFLGFGYTSDIVEGALYAVDNGASVINMSLGGTQPSLTEYNAYQVAYDAGVFIAAAAGNSGDVGNPIEYPGGYAFTIAVGASDPCDDIAYFSSHGFQVEVSAPGVETLSTILGGGYEAAGWSGTSMSTPHVAGLAALLFSEMPTLSNWQVRLMIREGVVDAGAPGWDRYHGFGRIDCPTLLGVSVPSTSELHLINPVEGSVVPRTAVLTLLWSPVDGAQSYTLTVNLPTGPSKEFDLSKTVFIIPPRIWRNAPVGTYTWEVQALDPTGGVIAQDSSSFSKP